MKKQLLCVSLLLTSALLLTACNSATAQTSTDMEKKTMQSTQDTTSSATPKTDGTSDKTMTDGASDKAMADGASDKAMTDGASDKAMTDKSSDKTMTDTKSTGTPAPEFSFTDFDGNTVTLADFKDKKVYAKFWASWCSICVAGLPELDDLAKMDKDFEVIAVVAPGYNGEKSMEDFKTWYAKKGFTNIKVLFDTDGKYMKEFDVRAFPSSAYIDGAGQLQQFKIGHQDNQTVIDTFKQM